MSENRKLQSASDAEIQAIIVEVAKTKGQFLLGDIEAALLEAGIQPQAVNWKKVLDATYQRDDIVPKHPYSVNLPIKLPQPLNPLEGMPNLAPTGGNIVKALYRKVRGKHGGISPQAPKDLRPK